MPTQMASRSRCAPDGGWYQIALSLQGCCLWAPEHQLPACDAPAVPPASGRRVLHADSSPLNLLQWDPNDLDSDPSGQFPYGA